MAKKQNEQTLKVFGKKVKIVDSQEEITIRKPPIKEGLHYFFIGLMTLAGVFIFFHIFFGVLAAYYSFEYIQAIQQNFTPTMQQTAFFLRFWSILWVTLAFSLIGAYLSRRRDE